MMIPKPSWLMLNREDLLNMADEWIIVFALKGAAWGIPAVVIAELNDKHNALEAAITALARDPGSRMKIADAELAAANLKEHMRDIKRRWLFKPPLTDADFISLYLAPPKETRSKIGAPDAQITGTILTAGEGVVKLRDIRYVANPSTDPRSDYQTVIYFGLTGTPSDLYPFRLSEAPKNGNYLPYNVRTHLKKYSFDLNGESGNRIYVCFRLENAKGILGPFGPILTIVIP